MVNISLNYNAITTYKPWASNSGALNFSRHGFVGCVEIICFEMSAENEISFLHSQILMDVKKISKFHPACCKDVIEVMASLKRLGGYILTSSTQRKLFLENLELKVHWNNGIWSFGAFLLTCDENMRKELWAILFTKLSFVFCSTQFQSSVRRCYCLVLEPRCHQRGRQSIRRQEGGHWFEIFFKDAVIYITLIPRACANTKEKVINI